MMGFFIGERKMAKGVVRKIREDIVLYAIANIEYDNSTNTFYDRCKNAVLGMYKGGRTPILNKCVSSLALAVLLREGKQYEGRIIPKDGDCANCREENLLLVSKVAKGTLISHERLISLLTYYPESGLFKWRNNPSCLNEYAGYDLTKGYRGIKIDGVRYQLHRLAWFYHYGEWPKYCIDHIDSVRDNNAISNLRDVTMNINAQNKRAAPSNARTTKVLGVYLHKCGKYQAQIKKDKIWYNCGTHDTIEEAQAAYIEMKRKLHPGNML